MWDLLIGTLRRVSDNFMLLINFMQTFFQLKCLELGAILSISLLISLTLLNITINKIC